jgi:hypothetical protein
MCTSKTHHGSHVVTCEHPWGVHYEHFGTLPNGDPVTWPTNEDRFSSSHYARKRKR